MYLHMLELSLTDKFQKTREGFGAAGAAAFLVFECGIYSLIVHN
jgi:hypothetical protein